jgi:hypothetical protein
MGGSDMVSINYSRETTNAFRMETGRKAHLEDLSVNGIIQLKGILEGTL